MAHSGTIVYMRSNPDRAEIRVLTRPLMMKMYDGTVGEIPVEFPSDGASVPWLLRGIFPRHDHPIATFRHDWRCIHAKSKEERLWSDKEFEKDVGTTSNWLTRKFGYIGVRIGSIGNKY